MTSSSGSRSASSSGSNSSSGSTADVRLLNTSGWALVVVFVITVVATALPLDVTNLAWSQDLSRLIVDACSLPLVGLTLVRYSLYLQRRSLPRSDGEASSSRSSSARARERIERWRMLVKRLALAGVVGMVLLAVWQTGIFFRSVSAIDQKLNAASSRESQGFVAVEKALSQASEAEVKQAWADFKGIKPGTPVLDQPATAEQRKQLLAAAKSRNAQVLERFDKDASTVIFIEGRDRVRVLLVALVYAAAFWAFLKRA